MSHMFLTIFLSSADWKFPVATDLYFIYNVEI